MLYSSSVQNRLVCLTSMLNNLTNDLPILDPTPNLLWQRVFCVVILARQIDVDARALAGEDLCVLAFLAKVDCRTIDLVEEDGGQRADDLEGEVGALDDIDRGDERVDDDGGARRVVDGDGVSFAVDADGGVLAAGNEDGVVELGVELDNLRGAVEVILRLCQYEYRASSQRANLR
jgi:hypothetical protein